METAPAEIVTARALLRRLREEDFPAFARMNADAEVMQYFPKLWSTAESRRAFDRINADFDERGFGIYALQVDATFAGIVGLSIPSFQSWFTPCVEILWRLRTEFWGRGLASEAAAMVLTMAEERLSFEEVFSFGVAQNSRSMRVMEKIGMVPCDPPVFDHPEVNDSNLKQHLLYRVRLRRLPDRMSHRSKAVADHASLRAASRIP